MLEVLSVDEELSVEELEELSELLELSGVLTETVISDKCDVFSEDSSECELHPQRKTAETSAGMIFFIIPPSKFDFHYRLYHKIKILSIKNAAPRNRTF